MRQAIAAVGTATRDDEAGADELAQDLFEEGVGDIEALGDVVPFAPAFRLADGEESQASVLRSERHPHFEGDCLYC